MALAGHPIAGAPIAGAPVEAPPAGGFFGRRYYESVLGEKMSLEKNVAGQKWRVFAFNKTTGAAVTGDAANITAKISKDHAAAAATNDVNPTEIEDGFYDFDLTQAETNAKVLHVLPQSTTADVQVIGVPGAIFTVGANFSDMGIETDGDVHADLKQWLGVAPLALSSQRVQTAVGAMGAGVVSAAAIAAGALDGKGDWALASAYTAARAGYLDNLNIGGNVASSSEATAIQNNTRVVRVVPAVFERPDAGSTAFRIELFLYDSVGNMEAPDSAPTIGVVNEAGTSRDVNLDATTMTLISTGRYRSTYTIGTGHALEQLVFTFTVTEGAVARSYANAGLVVDTTAVDFTAADRTKLDTLHDTRIPEVLSLANILAQVNAALDTAIPGAPTANSINERLTALDDAYTAARAAFLDNLNGHIPQTGDSFARLAAYRLGELMSAALASQPFAGSLLGDLTGDDAGTQRFTANALELAPAGAADPAAIADAVWDEAAADHNTAATMGEKMNAAGGAADPLLNTVPGSYAAGTAGSALGKIGSGQITTVSPVGQSGDVEIVRGDDYAAADGRSLDWTDADDTWPVLTGATIAFTAGAFSKAGSVVTATGSGKKVRVELTDTETASLRQGSRRFTVRATLAGGSDVVLVQGNLVIKAD